MVIFLDVDMDIGYYSNFDIVDTVLDPSVPSHR